ncbi:hypothetical protein RHGRI_020735 [Rhododendron griersonianum]|uniref:Uncharacterized protein n=1 Tax=Rhododendron griersonianum TaxID=479676 RepID=A0AAV6JKU9_9ERIC|nr:hypothetical protein RHGRI_020735 [Rhododendron griersonianum]
MASSKPRKCSSLRCRLQFPILTQTKQTTSDTDYIANRLLKNTGKATWIAGTTFLILVVPLIIEMDREQQP